MAERKTDHIFDRWLKSAQAYEKDWRNANQQAFEYYDGEQWTDEERTAIEARGQQPTVINTISPTVDMVRSIEVDRRADIQVCGREGSDDAKSQLLTELLKHVFDTCNFDFYHSECFREALIGGRSWIEVSVVRNELGKDIIVVNHIPWNDIYVDPCSRKPDASDARFIIKQKWVDRDVAKMLFPDAIDEIDSVFNDDYKGQEYEAQKDAVGRNTEYYYDRQSKRVKICECYYTMPSKEKIKVKNEITGKDEDKVVALNKVHYVIFSDEIILQGSAENHGLNVNPNKINYYTLIPIYATRDRLGRPRGMVRNLIDLQDQINKLNSKFLWTVATNRLMIEEGAARDNDEAREEMQKPDGLVILNQGGLGKIRVDDKYRDLSYMSNHLSFLLSMLQRISGVNDSVLGLGGANERSGIMQSARISQGAAMQTSILENLYFSKQRIAFVILRLMGVYYTDYRILRISAPNGTTDTYEYNKPQLNEKGEVTGILNKIEDTLYYDVILKKVAPFSTQRERMLSIFSEVLKAGVIPAPVAAKLMLTLSDAPHKEDLILEIENFYKEQQQMAAQQAQAGSGEVGK